MSDNPMNTPRDLSTTRVSPNEPASAVMALRNASPPVWLGALLRWIFPIAGVLYIGLIVIPGFLQKWLWMRQLDYAGIFWTLFSVKVVMTGVGFIFAVLFLWFNLRHAARSGAALADLEASKAAGSAGETPQSRRKAIAFARHLVTRSTLLIIGFVAVIFANLLYLHWDTYLRFRYGGSFGLPTQSLDWTWASTCSACRGMSSCKAVSCSSR